MIYLGIDPGKSGAIVALDRQGLLVDKIALDATERDVWDFLANWVAGAARFAVVEKVHSMPKQGVSSTFKFGQSYGFLRGILTASMVPFDEVTPQAWQKYFGCLSRGDKNVTKAKAQQLFPKEKITHRYADAFLI